VTAANEPEGQAPERARAWANRRMRPASSGVIAGVSHGKGGELYRPSYDFSPGLEWGALLPPEVVILGGMRRAQIINPRFSTAPPTTSHPAWNGARSCRRRW
jgi:hypothetical protein